MEIRKGIPRIKQEGKVSNEQLTNHLGKCGYSPVTCTPELWCHTIRDLMFTLCADNFGIKYAHQTDVDKRFA